MSRENVEIVRQFFAATNRGDLRAASKLAHPQIAVQDHPAMPDAGWHHGLEGSARWWAKINEVFEGVGFEDVEALSVGKHTVVGTVTVSGQGGQSGAPVTMPTAFLVTLDDGVAERVALFKTLAEALRAAADLLEATEPPQ